ncbi:MAG: LamG domain-containing protein [Sandaracinaceae bacterium]|nr:LamG domain-containing protein [Sandaracinaceae bacterium]
MQVKTHGTADTGIDAPRDAFLDACDFLMCGLIAYYPFDPDRPLEDRSGNGHRLTPTDDVSFSSGIARFNGGRLSGASPLRLNQTRSIALWVRPRMMVGGGARMGLVDKERAFGLFIYEGQAPECRGFGIEGVRASDAGVEVGRWTHLACVREDGRLCIYVGGAQQRCQSTSSDPPSSMHQLFLGQDSPDGGDAFFGDLDEVRLYDRPLSAGEIGEMATRPPP